MHLVHFTKKKEPKEQGFHIDEGFMYFLPSNYSVILAILLALHRETQESSG